MRLLLILGVALIIFGLTSLINSGFTYRTTEKILDLGPVEATKNNDNFFPIPTAVGAISLLTGLSLVVVSSRAKVSY